MLSLLHFPGEGISCDCIIHVLTCICAWAARVTCEHAASCSEEHLTDICRGVPCFEKGHLWYMHNVTCTAALGVNCAMYACGMVCSGCAFNFVLETMLTSALALTHTFTCSNQFLNQEPGSNDVIKQFAQDKGFMGFLMDKIDVNGSEASPVYTFLKVGLHKALLAAV